MRDVCLHLIRRAGWVACCVVGLMLTAGCSGLGLVADAHVALVDERRTDQARERQDERRDSAIHVPGVAWTLSAPGVSGSYLVTFRDAVCPFRYDAELYPEVVDEISCGYMTVPEDRALSDGPTIEIAVATVVSKQPDTEAVPLVYLEGGPGTGAVYDAEWWLDSPLREGRALILVDQRGTGYSLPNLSCPELNDDASTDGEYLELIVACRDRLQRLGVDLAAYHSVANAQDLADLQRVLGIEQWDLLGISYGSRLALTLLGEQVEGIRAVVLDSVYPPRVTAYNELPSRLGEGIDRLLDGCAADRACNRAFPGLRRDFYDFIRQLDGEPLFFGAAEFDIDVDLEVDGYTLLLYLRDALYDTDLIPWLPMLIAQAFAGDYELLLDELLLYVEDDASWDVASEDDDWAIEADGMYYSVECFEEARFTTLDAAATLGSSVDPTLLEMALADVAFFLDACDIWLGGRTAEVKAGPVASGVPVLILAGEYDPVTPTAWSRLAGETLPNHYYVELPRGGHGLTFADECITDIIVAFLDDPGRAPDAACIDNAVRPFERP